MNNMKFQEDIHAALQDLRSQIRDLTTIANQLHSKRFGHNPPQTMPSPLEENIISTSVVEVADSVERAEVTASMDGVFDSTKMIEASPALVDLAKSADYVETVVALADMVEVAHSVMRPHTVQAQSVLQKENVESYLCCSFLHSRVHPVVHKLLQTLTAPSKESVRKCRREVIDVTSPASSLEVTLPIDPDWKSVLFGGSNTSSKSIIFALQEQMEASISTKYAKAKVQTQGTLDLNLKENSFEEWESDKDLGNYSFSKISAMGFVFGTTAKEFVSPHGHTPGNFKLPFWVCCEHVEGQVLLDRQVLLAHEFS
ncbi:hypothetical protein CR513_08476, partial [Mucuna pruriens]